MNPLGILKSVALQNLAISIAASRLTRNVPFDDPEVTKYCRMFYYTVQLVVISTLYFIKGKIKSNKDKTELKYVAPQNPFSIRPAGLVTTTIHDYDLKDIKATLRSAIGGVLILTFVHYYFGAIQPLFVQAIMGAKGLFDAKMFSIYVLGKKAEGDLQRPFKGSGPFGANPVTDKVSIAQVEERDRPPPKHEF